MQRHFGDQIRLFGRCVEWRWRLRCEQSAHLLDAARMRMLGLLGNSCACLAAKSFGSQHPFRRLFCFLSNTHLSVTTPPLPPANQLAGHHFFSAITSSTSIHSQQPIVATAPLYGLDNVWITIEDNDQLEDTLRELQLPMAEKMDGHGTQQATI